MTFNTHLYNILTMEVGLDDHSKQTQMGKEIAMALWNDFFEDCLAKGKTKFTTNEALLYYQEHKAAGSMPACYTNLNTLILKPLQFKGLIRKEARGVFKLLPTSKAKKRFGLPPTKKEDSFEQYIQGKLGNGKT